MPTRGRKPRRGEADPTLEGPDLPRKGGFPSVRNQGWTTKSNPLNILQTIAQVGADYGLNL